MPRNLRHARGIMTGFWFFLFFYNYLNKTYNKHTLCQVLVYSVVFYTRIINQSLQSDFNQRVEG